MPYLRMTLFPVTGPSRFTSYNDVPTLGAEAGFLDLDIGPAGASTPVFDQPQLVDLLFEADAILRIGYGVTATAEVGQRWTAGDRVERYVAEGQRVSVAAR